MGRLIPMAPNPVPPTLAAATGAFLDQRDHAPSTHRVYTASLAALVDGFGAATGVDELDPAGTAAWFRLRYTAAAPATWNRELATLRSAVTWWRAQGWLEADPTVLIERRRETPGPDPGAHRRPAAGAVAPRGRRAAGQDAVAAAV